jgi:hypothetical protein
VEVRRSVAADSTGGNSLTQWIGFTYIITAVFQPKRYVRDRLVGGSGHAAVPMGLDIVDILSNSTAVLIRAAYAGPDQRSRFGCRARVRARGAGAPNDALQEIV